MEPNRIELTRRELYDKIWNTPVEVLARQWGLSDRGLSKLCDRHGIPVPPRGYWARRKAGKTAIRPPLIEINRAQTEPSLQIRKGPQTSSKGDPRSAADPFEALLQQLRAEVGCIKAEQTLARPHPIVARWIADDRAHQAEIVSLGYGFTPTSQFASALAKRRLRLISCMLKTLEARGFMPEHDRVCVGDYWVRSNHATVRFDIRERYRILRRRPTAAEQAQPWRSGKEWIRERAPTGELALKIQGHTPSCLRGAEWVDEGEAKLESKLGEIVAGVIVTAAFISEMEAERARAEHARWEAQVAARRRADHEAAELKRSKALTDAAAAWRESTLVLDYVAAVQEAVAAGRLEVSSVQMDAWVTWAKSVARTKSQEALKALPGAFEAPPKEGSR
jgi:hypothetical protein